MNGVDIAVIVIISLAALGVAGRLIYKKVKRKGGCCGCDCCDCCGGCAPRKDGKKE